MASANEFAKHDIRVNAIAPVYFIGKHYKALLINDEAEEFVTGASNL